MASAVVTVPVEEGPCTPAVPPSISVSPTSATLPNATYTVTWQPSASTCVTTYQLEELFNQSQWQPVALSDTQNQQRTWSPDPPKSVPGTCSYRVSACGQGSCSTAMVGATVTVSAPTAPAVPTGLKACRGTDGPPCEAAGGTLELIGRPGGSNPYRISWNAVEKGDRVCE